MLCHNCRAPLSAGARFCATCGAPAPVQPDPVHHDPAPHDPALHDPAPHDPALHDPAHHDPAHQDLAPHDPHDPYGPDTCDATVATGLPLLPPQPPAPPSAWSVPGLPPTAWPEPVPIVDPPTVTGRARSRLPFLAIGAAAVVLVLAAAIVVPRLLDGGGAASGDLVMLSGGTRYPLASGVTGEPEKRWTVEAETTEAGGIAVGDDRLFGVESNVDGDRVLVARSLTDGEELWSEDLSGTAVLHLFDDHLVAQVTEDDSGDAKLRRYDRSDGEVVWDVEAEPELFELSRYGDHLIGLSTEEVIVHRLSDGEEAWSEPASVFAVSGDRVLVADGDEIEARAMDDGTEAWAVELSGEAVSMVLAGDRVLASSFDDEIVSLSADDGEEIWKEAFDIGSGSTLHALGGSSVVAVGDDGAVAIDAGTGKTLEGFEVDEADWSGIGYRLPDGQILMFRSEDSTVTVFDRGDGERVGRVDETFGNLSTSMLYTSDDDARLSGYRLDDMERAWSVEVDRLNAVVPGDGLLVLQTYGGYELWR